MKNKILYILILLIFLLSVFRISYLMIYKRNYYNKTLYNKQNKIIYGTSAPRGSILDKNGNIIVDNIGVKTIIYNKLNGISEIKEISIAEKLANIIDIEYCTDEELKYYYYIKYKNSINSLLDKEILKKYEERKITSNELLEHKLNLISDNMLNTLSDLERRASKIYNILFFILFTIISM